MSEKVKEQILQIRDSALTNMFDIGMVIAIAAEFGFAELIEYIENNRSAYVHFILTGEAE